MKLKVGLVGCGRISASHFASLAELSNIFELSCVCDIDSQVASNVAQSRNIDAFTHLDSLLKRSELDLISICTPSGLHATQGIQALQAGFHVIVEKPMATRYEDGLALVAAAERAQKKLFVVKQNRLNPTLQILKGAIDQGRFGRISIITSNVFWTRPQSYYDLAPWRGTWDFDGGAFMNQASHYVDLLTWLMGPVETLSSFNATLGRRIEAEDCGVLSLKFRNGAMGTLNVSMLTYPKNFEGSITIIGEKGLARIGGIALNKIEAWEFADSNAADKQALELSYETNSVYGFGHRLVYEEVAKNLNGQPNQATSGRAGLISLATLVGAYRSAKNGGQPIGFPLNM
jgi:UDP-N-acetyl-2-amino-2-deoxyglucuronate dehydrogenase